MTERSQPIDKDAVSLAPNRCLRALDDIRALFAHARTDAVDMVERIWAIADDALAHPTEQTDDAMVEAVEIIEALVECHIKRGPWDEPLGSSEQAPSINSANAFLAKLESRQ